MMCRRAPVCRGFRRRSSGLAELFDDPDSLRHFVGLVNRALLILEISMIHRDSNSTTANSDLSHDTVRDVWPKRLNRACQ